MEDDIKFQEKMFRDIATINHNLKKFVAEQEKIILRIEKIEIGLDQIRRKIYPVFYKN